MRIQLSGCAIINEREELLLLWKIKHQHFEFPGGKVELGETLEETAKRECREELGVDVTLIKYLGYEDFDVDGRSFQSHKYLGVIEGGQVPKVNEPTVFERLFWLPMREYEKYSCAPNVRSFCQKVIDRKIDLSFEK